MSFPLEKLDYLTATSAVADDHQDYCHLLCPDIFDPLSLVIPVCVPGRPGGLAGCPGALLGALSLAPIQLACANNLRLLTGTAGFLYNENLASIAPPIAASA